MADQDRYQVAAVITAAGRGKRLGAGKSKALVELRGRPILSYALEPFLASNLLDVLVVVIGADDLEYAADLLAGLTELPAAVVPGGGERVDSVRAGLEWLSTWTGWQPGAGHLVAIHDAARPFLSPTLWERVLLAAVRAGAAVPGLPVVDTLKRVDENGWVEVTVARERLQEIQTPQVFTFEKILEAHRRARAEGGTATDDAQVWENAGWPVLVVPGERENMKITTPADLTLADDILSLRSVADEGGPGL